ncbi:hypothetical protein [Candidatus Sulfurimonas baltica]|uniref:Uncharacterized protein n=1 Tax=Candidatus Sulfurimonas baltica TaxID=2740404 RepID=A0A7S7RN92_9BACT|nr:hypothetical protein [Candidatus Sulfurimonas baltica]QOY52304.1 hypothetical protein HUE88_01010 [Candidatus Sulfurimonas baltica]
MYEADKNEMILGIDNLITTIETRLLPSFDNLEVEAQAAADKRLEELAETYGGAEDPSPYYEEAYDTGGEYYVTYTEMKNDFLNMTTVWLYHLFEQDCNKIFSDTKWGIRKEKIASLSISTITPSNFYKINEELQHICDINKHGDGRAKEKLLVIRPDLIDSKIEKHFGDNPDTTTHTLKNISLKQLKEYAEYMKSFWIELYEALQLKKSM